jgi:hypothetical protein
LLSRCSSQRCRMLRWWLSQRSKRRACGRPAARSFLQNEDVF